MGDELIFSLFLHGTTTNFHFNVWNNNTAVFSVRYNHYYYGSKLWIRVERGH